MAWKGRLSLIRKKLLGSTRKQLDAISACKKGTLQENAEQKGGNEKRYSSFKIQELGKKEADTKALITVDTLENWKEHESGDDEGFAPKEYGMVVGCGAACEEGAAEVYSLITGNGTDAAAGEFALMGMTSEVQNCPFGWESELGWDDSEFSIFTLKSAKVEGRPHFNRFAKTDSMKAVPPPLSGDYTPLSDDTDLDESQMSYGTKSSTSGDSNSVSNDFVSCDNSDKSSEVNSNDFASSDSSVKTSEPKSNDSTSCASTSSISTSESEAEIESFAGTPIQETINVQDLPSFSCNSFDKNGNTSRTSCNKNGYFNKKAGHFRKNASSVSKELIWDNATRVTQSNHFVPQAVLLRSGKVSIPAARPNQVSTGRPKPVPTGKPKVPEPVPTGRQTRPFTVPSGRRYSLSVTSGWWKSTENPYSDAEDEGIFDSGCSRSMTCNMERLDDFQEFQGGKVTFGGGEGRITGKRTIKTPTLDFENVYYMKELQHFNLFSISQICDKKNRVLFTDTDCLVLSKDFMLPDESMVLLRVPWKHNLYTINLNNLSPKGNLACLMAKASVDEYVQWHRRMGHVNYKNMNRLVKGNLVRGLPPKLFKNDHTCIACCKGKQHKASYKAITVVSSISEPLQLLHMDLFGPTSIRSIDHKYYCLVIIDDYSRIKRDYSNARTPQQNGVAERKNRTLIEAARTMLADSKLPTMFWTEVVRTACYVLNRVLVTSPHHKTPYALLTGNIPSVSHFKPFGCHVTILNTSDHLGKFDGKADEGYIVGYSASNRAYRVYNVHNKRVEETMNLRYLEEKPNVQGLGHEWYFDLDYLTDTLGYKRVQANQSAGTQEASTNPAGTQDADSDSECDEQVIIIPSYPSHNLQEAEPKDTSSDEGDDSPHDSAEEIFQQELARLKGQVKRATSDVKDAEELQQKARTKTVPPGSIPVPTGSIKIPSGGTTISPGNVSVPTGGVPVPTGSPTDSFFDDEPTTRFPSPSDLGNNEPSLGIFSSSSYDDEFGADLNNLASTVEVSPVATKRINTIHPQSLIIGDHTSAVQTRSKVNKTPTGESAFISYIHDQQRNNHTDFQHCLFACFLSQVEPRTIAQALEDPSWVDAMQEEMQQFKFQNVWVLVDLPEDKYAIGTKWILKNKRDARGIVVRNKARLVAQGHRQEEGIDYDEVFAPVARIEAIRLFLAFASYLGSMVYQMDVKSVFLYSRIDEEVYVTQPKGFVDPQHPKKVYKVVKALYGLHQAPRAWYATLSTFLLKHGYRRGTIDKTLFLKKHKRDIILVQVYVDDIIFGSTKKAWCDEFEALMKGEFEMSAMGELTFFLGLQVQQRPDGIFINQDNACLRNQVTHTTSNLEVVKKIFKYLKGQPKLGLWYPRESPFMLEAYSDSDYAGANKDRKSTTGGSEYVAAANCCGQVLWIQNQLLDYGYNFMNTKIFIDNQSTICIVKNPVFHQRTKHIEIRHHFIRDSNDKKLIQVLKTETDDNVVDLLTKTFDGPRFNHLVVNIGMLNSKIL
ncbi:putative ribonuclease H-like domain-containing protein [Tanacetum coccineum]|uniref:Ribonuclease H-like domain-containing protein n=1 Tax=Tanacetum coccineum TaxID=301880 RepID=A0ABQ4ZX73_9ASTR